jgi:FkbM family methyltransferase
MGLEDFHAAAFLLHLLREADCFCDVGANVGAYTLLASGVCKAKTIAVEPVSETFALLRENLALNHLGELASARNVAAGAARARLLFTSDLGTMNRVAIGGDERKTRLVEVEVLPLDDILNQTVLRCSPFVRPMEAVFRLRF